MLAKKNSAGYISIRSRKVAIDRKIWERSSVAPAASGKARRAKPDGAQSTVLACGSKTSRLTSGAVITSFDN